MRRRYRYLSSLLLTASLDSLTKTYSAPVAGSESWSQQCQDVQSMSTDQIGGPKMVHAGCWSHYLETCRMAIVRTGRTEKIVGIFL